MSTTYLARVWVSEDGDKTAAVIEALRVAAGTAMFWAVDTNQPRVTDSIHLFVRQEVGLCSSLMQSERAVGQSMIRAIRKVVGRKVMIDVQVLDSDRADWRTIVDANGEQSGDARVRR